MADLEWLEGGVTAVPGILAGGIAAGIKPSGKKVWLSCTPRRQRGWPRSSPRTK